MTISASTSVRRHTNSVEPNGNAVRASRRDYRTSIEVSLTELDGGPRAGLQVVLVPVEDGLAIASGVRHVTARGCPQCRHYVPVGPLAGILE